MSSFVWKCCSVRPDSHRAGADGRVLRAAWCRRVEHGCLAGARGARRRTAAWLSPVAEAAACGYRGSRALKTGRRASSWGRPWAEAFRVENRPRGVPGTRVLGWEAAGAPLCWGVTHPGHLSVSSVVVCLEIRWQRLSSQVKASPVFSIKESLRMVITKNGNT